jgi:hypothetical protein
VPWETRVHFGIGVCVCRMEGARVMMVLMIVMGWTLILDVDLELELHPLLCACVYVWYLWESKRGENSEGMLCCSHLQPGIIIITKLCHGCFCDDSYRRCKCLMCR